MKIVFGEYFHLPRVGKDAFISLMKAGVEYEKGKGFRFVEGTDVPRAIGIIEAATGKKVELIPRCFMDGKPAGCEKCEYRYVCNRLEVSNYCLCDDCYEDEGTISAYYLKFSEELE